MKKILIFFLMIVMIVGVNDKLYSFNIEYNQEIVFNNNNFTLGEVISLSNLIEKSNPLVFNDHKLTIFSKEFSKDLSLYYNNRERILINKLKPSLYFGYQQIEEQLISADKETLNLIAKRNEKENTSYNLNFSMLKQRLKAFLLGIELITNQLHGINLFLDLKLLQGIELFENNYNAVIAKKEDKMFLTGFSDGINTNINKLELLNNKEIKSNGYSLGFKINWQIGDYLVELKGEDILNKIFWQDVYTYSNFFYKTSMGLYPSCEHSFSIGNIAYEKYETSILPKYKLEINNQILTMGMTYKNQLNYYFNYKVSKKPVDIVMGFYNRLFHLDFSYQGLKVQLSSPSFNIFSSQNILGQITFKI